MNIMLMIFSFNVGGIERQMIDMARIMIRRGNHVSICIINKDYTDSLLEEFPEEVPVYKLNKPVGTRNFLPYMHRLSQLITQDHTEILHCQGINCVLFSAIARMQHKGLAVLNTVHACGNYPSYSSAKIFFQNRICSMTVAISYAIEKEILSRKMDPDKVTVIYNAIDTNKFQYVRKTVSTDDPDVYRHTADTGSMDALPSGTAGTADSDTQNPGIEIGQVARIYPTQKGQDTLVRAIIRLKDRYPSIHCSFAGDVFKGQDAAFQELNAYIHKNHAEQNFTFLGNVNDVPSFLHTLDIFVLPSHTEGFGIALAEAMACGIPCIASRLAGPEEILNDPKLGILFEPGNDAALADAIDQMMHHIQDYDPVYISDNARRRFNIEDMVQRHLDLYQKLLTTK